jgi:hypothetical protein
VAEIQGYVQRHIWVISTAATAAAVFLIAFFAVSASTDGGDTSSVTTVDPPSPPGVTAFEADPDPTSASDGATAEAVTTIEPTAEPDGAAVSQAQDPPTTIPEPEVQATTPEPEPIPVPDFDEADLIHGGEGAQGANLAGPGIVPSSGFARRTDWELIVPSARIRARIVRIGATWNNALGAPDNPEVIGWWETGPEPGQIGNVLLDGHRDFSDIDGNLGTGVCWSLPLTDLGDPILIRDSAAGVFHIYEVTETTSVLWNDPEGVEFLRSTAESRLTLITCEGSFDGDAHNYSNRRIVVAQFMGTTPIPGA